MNRLEDKFNQLRSEGRKAFIAYIPFGFPHPRLTKPICLALEKGGADIIELGIPFSDPLADGPIIQRATSWALQKGANFESYFEIIDRLAKSLRIPLIIMTYYNPIFNFGVGRFLKKIKQLGIWAITIVDLPLEEASDYLKEARKLDLDTVFFITPTTSQNRVKKIAKASRGFIYYISVTGITGPRSLDYALLSKQLRSIKNTSSLPVCVGFGVHSRDQVIRINKFSDGVIVGSSIVKFIENNFSKNNFLAKLKSYLSSLKE